MFFFCDRDRYPSIFFVTVSSEIVNVVRIKVDYAVLSVMQLYDCGIRHMVHPKFAIA